MADNAISGIGFDPTMDNLEEAMQRATKVQSVIAQNIANANNPDYKAQEFDAVLNKAVQRSNSKVILEEEMAAMSKNAGAHAAYVKLLTSKLSILRSVVSQGRK